MISREFFYNSMFEEIDKSKATLKLVVEYEGGKFNREYWVDLEALFVKEVKDGTVSGR